MNYDEFWKGGLEIGSLKGTCWLRKEPKVNKERQFDSLVELLVGVWVFFSLIEHCRRQPTQQSSMFLSVGNYFIGDSHEYQTIRSSGINYF